MKYYFFILSLIVLFTGCITSNKRIKKTDQTKIVVEKNNDVVKKKVKSKYVSKGGLFVTAFSAKQVFHRAGIYIRLSHQALDTICKRAIWQIKTPCRDLKKYLPMLEREYAKGYATFQMSNYFFFIDSYLQYIFKFKHVYPIKKIPRKEHSLLQASKH